MNNQLEISQFLGLEVWNALEPLLKKKVHESFFVRKILIEATCNMYPGVVNAVCYIDFSDTGGLGKTTFLDNACDRYDYRRARLFLDLGATVTSRTCGLLNTQVRKYDHLLFIGDVLMKRLIRCGGLPSTLKYMAYKKQFELARNASQTLLGIRQFRQSPLILKGIHREIIQQIAKQVLERCEEIKLNCE